MDIFFDALVAFINESRNPKSSEDTLKLAAHRVSEHYLKQKKEENFWVIMDQNFLSDPELYFLLLSVIYYVTKDTECLKKSEQLYLNNNVDLFVADGMQYQVRSRRFRNPQGDITPYSVLREYNRRLSSRFQKEYKIQFSYIPLRERNKKRIVVVTDALLSRLHAPTNIVLELCEILCTYLGFEVFLVACIANTNGEEAQNYCVFPFQANFVSQYNGDFILNTGKTKLPAYQILFGKHTMGEFKNLLQRIYDWKPLCVWYVGGTNLWHDVCCQFITTISMPCIEGYSVSEADVLVSYAKSNGEHIEQERQYIRQQGQKMVDLETGWTYEKQPGERHRENYGIPADSVLLAVVGNRLEDEMNDTFLEFMERLAREDHRIYYAVIGNYTKPLESQLLKERVVFLGFCEDLLNALEMTDIFLNPPRQGGGGGAGRAQAAGKPVVSLKHCDVEAVCGEEFCYRTLDEMAEVVLRYCNDKEYYKKMSEKSLETYRMHSNVDMGEQYGKVLTAVESWLDGGEIR